MSFDLTDTPDTVAVESKGRRIVIYDERKKPYVDAETQKPCTALVYGTYSTQFLAAQAEINEQQSRNPALLTFEEKQAIQRTQYAACVGEWDFTFKGAMADPATIFKLKPHIFDQIVVAANAHADFFGESSTH